jgi:hypothetical protein
MADKFRMPKGRQTIRKNGGRRTRLWELSDSINPTVQRLEAIYLAGLDAMDRAEARHAANKADSRFTPDGVRDAIRRNAAATSDGSGPSIFSFNLRSTTSARAFLMAVRP